MTLSPNRDRVTILYMKKKIKIAVLFGGPSSEHEVSLASGANIVRALRTGENARRYQVMPIRFREPEELLKKLVGKKFANNKIDCVFPVLHGKFGEDGTLQALLETLGLPYVGCGVLASALCMDKVLSSELVAGLGMKVPNKLGPSLLTASKGHSRGRPNLLWHQAVVKPRFGGSSVGVSVVKSNKELASAIKKASKEGEVLVQKYLQGREFTCGVFEFENGKPFALPVTEIVPKSEFFDYKAKYTKGGSDEICPAQIPAKLTHEIQSAALLAHKTLGCRHISRSDFIFSKNRLYYLETNTMPGMTNTSLVPQAAAVAGISMPDLTHRLAQSSLI